MTQGRPRAEPSRTRWRRGLLAATAALLFVVAVVGLGWAGWQVWESQAPAPEPSHVFSPEPGAQTVTPGPEPTTPVPANTLAIPSLGIEAPLDVLGVANGALQLPPPQRATLYDAGARPGEAHGTVLVAGHVNSHRQGRGALFRLADITRGAQVWVTDTDGRAHEYAVVGLTMLQKTALPQDVFARDGSPRLVVVTCGGRVLESTRGRVYESNVIVEALPTGRVTPAGT